MSEKKMREALEAARQFIVNGVEFGYIRMPDADTPDSAHDTLPLIEEALAQQPVELTDEEIEAVEEGNVEQVSYHHPTKGMTFGQRFDNLRFARAVIAAHEAKKNGGA